MAAASRRYAAPRAGVGLGRHNRSVRARPPTDRLTSACWIGLPFIPLASSRPFFGGSLCTQPYVQRDCYLHDPDHNACVNLLTLRAARAPCGVCVELTVIGADSVEHGFVISRLPTSFWSGSRPTLALKEFHELGRRFRAISYQRSAFSRPTDG